MADAEQAVQSVADDAARKAAAEVAAASANAVANAEIKADETVDAAAMAVALANGTAVQAKQQAVETEGQFYEGVRKWQTETGSRMEKLELELAATRAETKGALSEIASGVSSLAQRLSTPQKSDGTETVTTVDPETGEQTTVQKEEGAPEGQKTSKKRRARFI